MRFYIEQSVAEISVEIGLGCRALLICIDVDVHRPTVVLLAKIVDTCPLTKCQTSRRTESTRRSG